MLTGPDTGIVLPPCPLCERPERVRSLAVTPVFYGVRYYVCDGCGHAWAAESPTLVIDR